MKGMKRWTTTIKGLILGSALVMIFGCSNKEEQGIQKISSEETLTAHSAEFKQEVLKVVDGVYVAIGFGLANSVLLEGTDGVVIVDTMESAEAAIPVKEAFNKITSKPVKAIIYTHYHTDHTFGARVMAGDDQPDIYSHEGTLSLLNQMLNITRETTYRRAMRQFGVLLPHWEVINAGIGSRLNYSGNSTPAILFPTKTFSGERLDLEIAGIQLVLIHAPGETPDQIMIWLPDKKVLLPADTFYKTFPNLYAIRGTPYRDVTLWVNSLDKMRLLRPKYLVPHHTRPISGSDKIYETLTHYRDAIQFVHDQTVRWMNKGLTPDEIVEQVKLPTHLASQPYLQEYYGTVAWSVRGIFDGYLGWFSGNATDLFPLPLRSRAERMSCLMGGEKAFLEHARKAVSDKDYQWALELTDQLLSLNPGLTEASGLRAQALTALGEAQKAATARNYYLTQALEAEGRLKIVMPPVQSKDLVHWIPLAGFFGSMAVRLDPEKAAEVDRVVSFRFPDTGEAYTVHVRRGVAEIQTEPIGKADNVVTVDSIVWKEIAAGLRNPALAFVAGDLKVEGGTLDLVKFLSLFK